MTTVTDLRNAMVEDYANGDLWDSPEMFGLVLDALIVAARVGWDKADRCDDVFRRAPCALRRGHDGDHVHMEECLPGVAEAADLASRSRRYGETLEQMRIRLRWPTPNHMRRVADALDIMTPAKYGDVLRWVADMVDASLPSAARQVTVK